MLNYPTLIVIIGFLLTSATIFLLSSAHHHRKIRRYLLSILPADDHSRAETAKLLGLDSIAVVGVSIFDVLYNTSRLDPFVLKGIEHLHHAQHFENLGDLVGFMKSNIIDTESGTKAWRDMIHKYKGYTGEEQGFNHISQSGLSFHVPESGTNPGFDAVVNGHHVDFAITDHPSYVQAKLDSDPHVLVWTNREMAHAFAGNPRVIVDPDLSSRDAFHITGDAISGIHNLGDFIHHIPLITLSIAATRNTIGVLKGNKGVATAIEHTALDTAGVGFGGYFGSSAGLGWGLMLAPVTGGTSAIVIPAVTTLIGTIIGVLSGKRVTNWFKERHLRSAIDHLSSVSASFQREFLGRFDELISYVQLAYETKKERCSFAHKEIQSWFKRTFFPSPLAKFYAMAIPRLTADWKATYDFYLALKQKITEVEPKEGGLVLYAQGSSILNGKTELVSAFDDVDKAVKRVDLEKQKLN